MGTEKLGVNMPDSLGELEGKVQDLINSLEEVKLLVMVMLVVLGFIAIYHLTNILITYRMLQSCCSKERGEDRVEQRGRISRKRNRSGSRSRSSTKTRSRSRSKTRSRSR